MSVKFGNSEFPLPLPELAMRSRHVDVYQKMMEAGSSTLVSIIAANRLKEATSEGITALLAPKMNDLDVWQLKDIEKAADRIILARSRGERIGLVTDFDVDGISSACVMKLALTEYLGFPEDNIDVFINNRMVFGYGFNEKVLKRIIDDKGDEIPTLLITADQGSNDSEQVLAYKEYMSSIGLDHADVIITDHHHINEGETCEGAVAFVNPQRFDDDFNDKTICGCVVALLVMSATREVMIKKGLISPDTPRLSSSLLTYASLATVADCVSLQSKYNRYIVLKGISDINNEVIPAWAVLKRRLNKPSALIDASDLGFMLGPAINADSRTGGDGSDAINFLLAKTVEDAELYYERLHTRNARRKEIDLSMQEDALKEASRQYFDEGRRGLVIYLPQGSHGIHGIVASRVKERFNCPTLIFSPTDRKEKDTAGKILTGSGRCIERMNIRDMAFDACEGIWHKGGGHPAAMGMKIRFEDLKAFHDRFDANVKKEAIEIFGSLDALYPRVLIDHVIQTDELKWLKDLNTLEEINRLGPYGQRFEAPVFAVNGTVTGIRPLGGSGNHVKIIFKDANNVQHQAVVWNFKRLPWMNEVAVGELITLALTLEFNSFEKGVQLKAEAVAAGFNAVTHPR